MVILYRDPTFINVVLYLGYAVNAGHYTGKPHCIPMRPNNNHGHS
jgi:hypothetical protein